MLPQNVVLWHTKLSVAVGDGEAKQDDLFLTPLPLP